MFAFQVHLLLIWKWGSGVFFLVRGLDFVGVSKVGEKLHVLFVGKNPPARLYVDLRPQDSVQLCLLKNGHLAYILDLGVISVW